METWLRNQIRNESENIADLGKLDEYQGMGTTLEALVMQEGQVISAHVGDSRTYLIRDGQLQKITTDHSLVQELVDAGQITEEEAEIHPNKNIITRSLGQSAEVQADLQAVDVQPGDYLLMNSDGLTNMISSEEILEVVYSEASIEEKTEILVGLANEAGGHDNITVILVKIDEESVVMNEDVEVD